MVSFVNLLRNGSAEHAWPWIRNWVDRIVTGFFPGRPSLMLSVLLDPGAAKQYYQATAIKVAQTWPGSVSHVPFGRVLLSDPRCFHSAWIGRRNPVADEELEAFTVGFDLLFWGVIVIHLELNAHAREWFTCGRLLGNSSGALCLPGDHPDHANTQPGVVRAVLLDETTGKNSARFSCSPLPALLLGIECVVINFDLYILPQLKPAPFYRTRITTNFTDNAFSISSNQPYGLVPD
jgi:hypothetical protein